jgi:hypothetical protein
MKHWMFKALLSLDGTAGRPRSPLAGPARNPASRRPDGLYPSEAHGLMVCAARRGDAGQRQFFPAVIETDDGEPLRPGDRHSHTVTITVNGEDPAEFFAPGGEFTVWNGREIGHGVVSRRVFFA